MTVSTLQISNIYAFVQFGIIGHNSSKRIRTTPYCSCDPESRKKERNNEHFVQTKS